MTRVLYFLLVQLSFLLNGFLLQKRLTCICNALHLAGYAYSTSDFDVTGVVAVSSGVLTQVIGQIGANRTSKALWPSRELTDLLMLKVSEFFEINVL